MDELARLRREYVANGLRLRRLLDHLGVDDVTTAEVDEALQEVDLSRGDVHRGTAAEQGLAE